MSRRRLHQLTERQLQIMDVLWAQNRATVAVVSEALKRTRLARKTVATQLTRLEKQGVVAHDVEGREFVYFARVTRDQVARAKLKSMLDYVVGGSVTALVMHALEADEVAPGDVAKVQELLEKHEAEKQP